MNLFDNKILNDAMKPLILRGEIATGQRTVTHTDDAYGDINLKELTQKSPYSFVRRTPVTQFDKLCWSEFDLVVGHSSYDYFLEDDFGTPQVFFGTTDDTPMVEVSTTTENTPVAGIKMGLSITDEELQAINMSSRYNGNLLDRKLNALMKKLDEKCNVLGFYGVPNRLDGFLTNANVPLDPATFDFYSSTDASQFAKEFIDRVMSVWDNTNGVERADTVLVPIKFLSFASSLFSATGDKKSALTLIKEVLDPYEVQIIARSELKASELEKYGVLPPGTNRDMMLIYTRKIGEPDYNGNVYPNQKRHLTQYYSSPWERTNSKYLIVVKQKLTGVYFSYPGSALRVTFASPS